MAHAAAWLALAYAGMAQADTYRQEAEDYLLDGAIWALDWTDKRGLVNVSLLSFSVEKASSECSMLTGMGRITRGVRFVRNL